MEGSRGHDRVEGLARQRPVLERRDDDTHVRECSQLALRDRRQVGAELHAGQPTAALRDRDRRLSGPDPNLEDTAARTDAGQLGQVIEEPGGIVRPHPVVALGVRAEGEPQPFALRFRHQ